MKTKVLFSKTNTFHSSGLFWTSPKSYILDHSKCMKIIVLSTSGSKPRKPSNQASWGWFWWLLEPRLESYQIEPPWTGFLDVCSQGQKVIKSSFLGLVLPTSWAKAGNSSNRVFWDSFCRLLQPRPESHQIESAGTSFVDFLNQCEKVMKSSFLGFVFSNTGAKARKSSNRVSWDWFCLINTWCRHILHQENIWLSDHRSLGHLLVGPLSTHRTTGGPTKNMCLRKNMSIILCPPPLSHPTLCCDLQSRHSTKCNVLKLQGGIAGFGK